MPRDAVICDTCRYIASSFCTAVDNLSSIADTDSNFFSRFGSFIFDMFCTKRQVFDRLTAEGAFIGVPPTRVLPLAVHIVGYPYMRYGFCMWTNFPHNSTPKTFLRPQYHAAYQILGATAAEEPLSSSALDLII